MLSMLYRFANDQPLINDSTFVCVSAYYNKMNNEPGWEIEDNFVDWRRKKSVERNSIESIVRVIGIKMGDSIFAFDVVVVATQTLKMRVCFCIHHHQIFNISYVDRQHGTIYSSRPTEL